MQSAPAAEAGGGKLFARCPRTLVGRAVTLPSQQGRARRMATLRRLPLLLLLAGAALVLALRRRVEAYEESGSPGSHRRHARVADVDAIIVLAGGVDASGRPHETVLRRLRAAARLHKKEAAATGRLVPILCNGGGTTHKPKWVDGQGYAVAEAALMAGVLARELGVPWSSIFAEGYSDDTVGNAFFARVRRARPASGLHSRAPTRAAPHHACAPSAPPTPTIHPRPRPPPTRSPPRQVMHMDARPDWRRLLIITSEFQIGRTRAIYDWVFSLPIAPLPTGAPPAPSPGTRYALDYLAVDDAGALPEQARP